MIAFAFADFDIWILAFVGLTPLICSIVASRRLSESVLLGMAASTVTWLINVPWVITVMSAHGGLPYATGVVIYVAMAFYLAIWGGLFGFLTAILRVEQRAFLPWLLIPVCWAASEYGRTHLLTGFPWNLLASAIIDVWPLVQISRWLGPFGIGALLVLPSVVLSWLIMTRARTRKRGVIVAATLALLSAWYLDGASRGYTTSDAYYRKLPKSRAAMLQPDISQEMRWDESNLMSIFERMASMTKRAVDGRAEVIIWPESTVPLAYASTEFFRTYVEQISRTHRADVILGSIARDEADESRLWNAAYLVSNGVTIGHYDKIRLVPFGEYVPMRKFLFFAEKLVRAVGTFQFGTNDRPLRGRFNYGPAICYEVVFPSVVATQVRHGADVIVTITNDAWFGRSSAPRQHLNSARLRAVETDRYILRAGTTGISAIVDPTGRILEQLPLDAEGVLFGEFSPRRTITPYVRFGDWFAIASCLLAVGGGAFRSRRRSFRKLNAERRTQNAE